MNCVFYFLICIFCLVGMATISVLVYELSVKFIRWVAFVWIDLTDNEFDNAVSRVRELERKNRALESENKRMNKEIVDFMKKRTDKCEW